MCTHIIAHLVGIWAALANAVGPCETMLMRERIEGEALQALLRYCIELVSWAAPWKDVRA